MGEELTRAIYALRDTMTSSEQSNRWLNENIYNLNQTVVGLNEKMVETIEMFNKHKQDETTK